MRVSRLSLAATIGWKYGSNSLLAMAWRSASSTSTRRANCEDRDIHAPVDHGNVTPLSMLDTEIGCREVSRVLKGIASGGVA